MKLISLNIEGHRHLTARVVPFIENERPDAWCAQEVFRADFEFLRTRFGFFGAFAPNTDAAYPENGTGRNGVVEGDERGIAIFSRDDLDEINSTVYFSECWGDIKYSEAPDRDSLVSYPLLSARVASDIVVATTHFVWTNDGMVDERQRRALMALLAALDMHKPMLLCGDFNAPRGREIFTALAARYRDNIPSDITTTIDGILHRAGPMPYVVDGLFTAPTCHVSNVRVVSGISDHCAIVADVEKM